MSLQAALNSPNGKQFSYHLDAFTSEQSEIITGGYAWRASQDPAIADDIDVQVDNDGITIANGTYSSPPARVGSTLNVGATLWNLSVKDIFTDGWGFFGGFTYRHRRTEKVLSQNVGFKKSHFFRLTHSMLVDGFDVGIGASYSGVYADGAPFNRADHALELEKSAKPTIYIEDADGNIVGNSVKLNTVGIDNGLVTINTVRGLNAYLTAGKYKLIFDFPLPRQDVFRFQAQKTYYISFSCVVYVYAMTGDPLLRIRKDNVYGFDLFGKLGFQPSATAWRSMSFSAAPTKIFYTVKDKVPLGGASYTTTLYSTNDDALVAASGIVGWTNQGAVVDGDTVTTTDRHFRIKFYMIPTTAADEAPYIFEVSLDAGGLPVTFSQHTEVKKLGNANVATSIPYLARVSWTVSGISVDTGRAIDGKTIAYILANGKTSDVLNFERGMRCELRFGVVGESDTTVISRGFLDDVNIRDGFYEIVIMDTAAIGEDANVPNDKYAKWDAVTVYTLGDKCAHNHRGYEALAAGALPAPTGLVGDTNWKDIGTVWVTKEYAAGIHLAKIALDLTQNEINTPDRYINHDAFDKIIARVPLRKLTALMVMDKQVKANTLRTELAMLLECFWARISGRIGLVPEALLADSIITTITHKDIFGKVTASLGKKSEVNTVFMRNGFVDGEFTDAYPLSDAALFAKHGNKIYEKAIDDRFGLPDTELHTIASNYIARRNGGRWRFQFDRHMRLNLVSLGDVVLLELDASNAPSPDMIGSYICMVESNQSDSNEKGRISLIEVKT